jgi:hypothetical protein
MGDQDIRAALDRHWAASEAGNDDAEDEIYHDDAVLEYPQSGERIRGRLAIRTTRGLPSQQALHHPACDWARRSLDYRICH